MLKEALAASPIRSLTKTEAQGISKALKILPAQVETAYELLLLISLDQSNEEVCYH